MALLKTLKEIAGHDRSADPDADAPAAGDPLEEAIALESVLLALHPDVADVPADQGHDPAQAADQLRLVAERIESRTAADEDGV
jgi:hypothetical protein